MVEDEISRIINEMCETTQKERARAAEHIKLSPKDYYARGRGFANYTEYQNWLAQRMGFANNAEYENWLVQRRGFANRAEYVQDLRFKKGSGSGLSMRENKNSTQYLGMVIAERLLLKIFQEPKMMPYGNPGYDAICKNGHRIDVKSSLLGKANFWTFSIKYNKVADFFICIAFSGSRDDLVVEHIWRFSGDRIVRKCPVNEMKSLVISDTERSLSRVFKYELTDKISDANDVCMMFKQGFLK